MDYISSEIIDGILERMRRTLKLPRVLESGTRYPGTASEEKRICYEQKEIERWKLKFEGWLGKCTHPNFILTPDGKTAFCHDCRETFRPDMQEVGKSE